MKREINCDPCADEWRKLIGRYPGELILIVDGMAMADYKCDGCYTQLREGDAVHCTSVLGVGQKYAPWEGEYITAPETKVELDVDGNVVSNLERIGAPEGP